MHKSSKEWVCKRQIPAPHAASIPIHLRHLSKQQQQHQLHQLLRPPPNALFNVAGGYPPLPPPQLPPPHFVNALPTSSLPFATISNPLHHHLFPQQYVQPPQQPLINNNFPAAPVHMNNFITPHQQRQLAPPASQFKQPPMNLAQQPSFAGVRAPSNELAATPLVPHSFTPWQNNSAPSKQAASLVMHSNKSLDVASKTIDLTQNDDLALPIALPSSSSSTIAPPVLPHHPPLVVQQQNVLIQNFWPPNHQHVYNPHHTQLNHPTATIPSSSAATPNLFQQTLLAPPHCATLPIFMGNSYSAMAAAAAAAAALTRPSSAPLSASSTSSVSTLFHNNAVQSPLHSYQASNNSGSNSSSCSESDGVIEQQLNTMPGFMSSGSVDQFETLNQIGSGTYGIVTRARNKITNEIVALKQLKLADTEAFPLSALREINALRELQHPNIVKLKEIVVGCDMDQVFMVLEYVDHTVKDLLEYTMKGTFQHGEIKCLMLQLLEGVKYLHDHWVVHRDLKTSNLLLDHEGTLKICDFGLSRKYGFPIKEYSPIVVTLWYRAPELLLGSKKYTPAIDLWSIGCIFFELVLRKPLFTGNTELEQLSLIFNELGTPTEQNWPGFAQMPNAKLLNSVLLANGSSVKKSGNSKGGASSASSGPNVGFQKRNALITGNNIYRHFNTHKLSAAGFDLLNRLLDFNPETRITAAEALEHPFFKEEPKPTMKNAMPQYPATNMTPPSAKKRRRAADNNQQQAQPANGDQQQMTQVPAKRRRQK